MYSESIGGVSWIDLTVEDAGTIKDFYKEVLGLEVASFDMGDYDDYVMKSPHSENDQVGICHARGGNADLPPQWLMYFNVADIDQSMQRCTALGGELIKPKYSMGDLDMCVIKDPSGAVLALVSKQQA